MRRTAEAKAFVAQCDASAQKKGMFRRCILAVAFFLSIPAIAAEPVEPALGHYRLTGVQDAASELELLPDGHFRYFLIYGALDEMAEGIWRRENAQIFLTTQPTPVPPQFMLKSAALTADSGLNIAVAGPDGEGIAGIDVLVRFADGTKEDGYTQQDGWRLDIPAGRRPEAVSLSIPMYGVQSAEFPISLGRANRLEFVLEPNDLGQADFRDLPLEPGRGMSIC